MGYVLVEGAIIVITVDPPVTSPGVPSHTLTVSSSGKVDVDTKKAALKSDMESQASVGGIVYINAPFIIPGELEWDGILSGAIESAKLDKDTFGIIVNDAGGTANFNVSTPAQVLSPPPPGNTEDDPGGPYPGTWSISNPGQTKLDTIE